MTVGEIIEELSKHDDNLPVGATIDGMKNVNRVEQVRLIRFPFGLEMVVIDTEIDEEEDYL